MSWGHDLVYIEFQVLDFLETIWPNSTFQGDKFWIFNFWFFWDTLLMHLVIYPILNPPHLWPQGLWMPLKKSDGETTESSFFRALIHCRSFLSGRDIVTLYRDDIFSRGYALYNWEIMTNIIIFRHADETE